MNIYESDLEDMLVKLIKMEDPKVLKERGLPQDWAKADLLHQQMDTGNGFADIILFSFSDRRINVKVIELKKDDVGFKTYNQALKYGIAISDSIFYNYGVPKDSIDIEYFIIGRKRVDLFAMANVSDAEIYTYSFDPLKGLYFEYHGYGGYVKDNYSSFANLSNIEKEIEGVLNRINQSVLCIEEEE